MQQQVHVHAHVHVHVHARISPATPTDLVIDRLIHHILLGRRRRLLRLRQRLHRRTLGLLRGLGHPLRAAQLRLQRRQLARRRHREVDTAQLGRVDDEAVLAVGRLPFLKGQAARVTRDCGACVRAWRSRAYMRVRAAEPRR